ncbi:MAG: peptide-methionine (S)-S-oxide reductase MsrA, partial [Bacteroidota bacterium]|nr:peptide-methionine (S)-S-oxide reductase MsrA [Bacteroidota bacterium]
MNNEQSVSPPEGKSFAILAGGCFWCTEAIYAEMNGVDKVESGYTGGHIKNPGYREICTGRTGHAEAVRITFDPTVVTFGELLEVFWRTHDPTTLNRQGADVGTQYRSAIFPMNEEQERVARASLAAAEEAGLWNAPIVTSIEPLAPFYVAEDYHQDYFANNPDQGYCVAGVGPKVKKFK